MTRLLSLLCSCSFLASAAITHAQDTRTGIPAGEVTGLEMTLEGPQTVRPGEQARWLVAVHEVVRDRDFRPATGLTLRMFGSLQRDEPLTEAQTDEHGRAILEMDVPEDVEHGFELLIDARSQRRLIRRRFRIYIDASPRPSLTADVLQMGVHSGQTNVVFGEVRDERGRPVSTSVELTAKGEDNAVLFGPRTVQTDADGVYAVPIPLRAGFTGSVSIEAKLDEETHVRTRTSYTVRRVNPSGLRISAVPQRRIARAGDVVPIDVYVRDSLGRPLAGALVSGGPPAPDEERPPSTQTDARGHARLPWHVRPTEQRFQEQRIALSIVAPGIGEGTARPHLRVVDADHRSSAVSEGGALIPGVPSRVFVRAVHANGSPIAGRALTVDAPRIGSHSATTDAEGIAEIEVELREEGNAAPDACGGATALAIAIRLQDADTETADTETADTETVCLPVDPDGTVRVRAERSEQGIAVELLPQRRVARLPTLVTLLRRDADRLLPVDQRVVPAGTLRVTLPTDVAREVVVRARPLVGTSLEEVRGGMALVGAVLQPAQTRLRVQDGAAQIHAPGVALLAVLPPLHAEALVRRFVDARPRTPGHLRADLAMRTPADLSAPAVLRDRRTITLPAPDEPVAHGVLRDPWRQRARYRTGRLALVIRALEQYVKETDDIADVAVRQRRGWRFNRAALDAIVGGSNLGAEGARDLGGLPLGIEALEGMDPALTFDRMARRITRERLLRAFVQFRERIQERGLDLAFGRRGSPSNWITALGGDLEVLRDGWGQPLQLRATPRATEFQVVPGWQLVSAGPDGRFGNADDVDDPTARILPSGGLYAQAMDEDGLLARLGGVALSRATLDSLAGLFDVQGVYPHAVDDDDESAGWASLPLPLPPARDPSRLLATGKDLRVLREPSGANIEPELPAVPADYEVVALSWEGGRRQVARAPLRHGGQLMLAGEWPTRLTRGETITLRPEIIAFEAVHGARVVANGVGVDVTVDASPIELDAGMTRPIEVQLRANENVDDAQLALRVEIEGQPVWARTLPLPVGGSGVERTLWASSTVEREWNVDFDLPEGALRPRGELVVVSHNRLYRDPLVQRRQDAALRGWAAALIGEVPSARTRAAMSAGGGLSRDRGPGALPSAVSSACSLIAWTALSDEVDDWESNYARAARQLNGLDQGTLDVRTSAAMLAALAPVAGGTPIVGQSDIIANVVESLRTTLWDTPRRFSEEPRVMARAAAALLLADENDDSGRALYLAAKELAEDAPRGGRWLSAPTPEEAIAATAALTIAAHVLGEADDARTFRRALGNRTWLALARNGDPAFWMLAASSYGALGRGPARGTLDGHALQFEDGVARHGFSPGDDVEMDLQMQGAALARIEVRYERDIPEASGGPMTLALEGDLGTASGTSAFEVAIENHGSGGQPELLVHLPANAIFDHAMQQRVQRNDKVLRVFAPDDEGVVRIQLTLDEGERTRIPLPLRWSGTGTTRGLALVGYDATQPWATTSVPARELVLRP